jgi:hypothetical protein
VLVYRLIKLAASRTLSSFFLGGVFLLALKYIAKSPGLQWISRGIGNLITPRSSSQLSLEQLEEDADEKARLKRWIEETFCGPSDNMDPKNIVLILSFFAANASLAMFGSTLQFMKGQDAVCSECPSLFLSLSDDRAYSSHPQLLQSLGEGCPPRWFA